MIIAYAYKVNGHGSSLQSRFFSQRIRILQCLLTRWDLRIALLGEKCPLQATKQLDVKVSPTASVIIINQFNRPLASNTLQKYNTVLVLAHI